MPPSFISVPKAHAMLRISTSFRANSRESHARRTPDLSTAVKYDDVVIKSFLQVQPVFNFRIYESSAPF
jgi:hypothetical protein